MVYMLYNIYKGDYMTEFKLIAYEKENGEVPVEQFLDSVNPKMRAKIFGLLGILQEKGKIILTNGFVKKTQKTPKEEIQIAKDRRKDFIERVMKDENI